MSIYRVVLKVLMWTKDEEISEHETTRDLLAESVTPEVRVDWELEVSGEIQNKMGEEWSVSATVKTWTKYDD